ncbi:MULTISPECIES: hypothetical protein [unclassified Microbacterium]|uniref:hypothetical protein n=1 Tax=unclassified Microbacterium TaxID=2609290 RepID=UPI0010572A02|nr:hypothetical protein [Microbacterium sp. TPD7012]
MNAQLKIAGHSPEPLGHGSALVDALPAALTTKHVPDHHTAATVTDDDEARISDWAEEGGAARD